LAYAVTTIPFLDIFRGDLYTENKIVTIYGDLRGLGLQNLRGFWGLGLQNVRGLGVVKLAIAH